MDLSQILDIGAGLFTTVSGYIGTDTMPPCTNYVCWYLYNSPFLITQQQLDFFKVDNVKHNIRTNNLAPLNTYKYNFFQEGLFSNN